MAEPFPPSLPPPPSGAPAGSGPEVHLELRFGSARPRTYAIGEAGFLIGTVPGCDLRLPGADLAPVICLLMRQADGIGIRKLLPTQPVLVNGQPLARSVLVDGDRLTIGPVELLARVTIHAVADLAGKPTAMSPDALVPGHVTFIPAPPPAVEMAQQQCQLAEQTQQLEADRVLWYTRREGIEQEFRQLENGQQALAEARAECEQRERLLHDEWDNLHRQKQALAEQAEQVRLQEEEIQAARRKLAGDRQQLQERYSERRDRLAGLQEAVNRAAAKVQERKTQLDLEIQQAAARSQEVAANEAAVENRLALQQAEIEARASEVASQRQQLEEQSNQYQFCRQQWEKEFAQRQATCAEREAQFMRDRKELDKQHAQHQADLVRLDRQSAALEDRQQQLENRSQELARHHEQLRNGAQEMAEHAGQLEAWRGQLVAEADRNNRQKEDLAARDADVTRRTGALEEQQGLLAALRTRLERTRDGMRQEEQLLTEQRARVEEKEADLRCRFQDVERRQAELDEAQKKWDEERQGFTARSAVLETAMGQIRQHQDRLALDEEQLRLRAAALDARDAELTEAAVVLQARSTQLQEGHDRLAADRQLLREREAALAQAEPAREALQDQLRRRSEELAERQRAQLEKERQYTEAMATQQTTGTELEEKRQAFMAWAADLSQRETTLHRHLEKLKERGQQVAGDRKALAAERHQWEAQRQGFTAEETRVRTELQALREETQGLGKQLPDWVERVRDAGECLTGTREQLRGHLTQLHDYASQAQTDIETMRGHVQAEAEQLRQQSLTMHRQREEHRLAVAGFRQQLIEWQGQVAHMKRALSQDETRLVRRHAEVEATSMRLARQAEQLQAQEREVTERRDEMERHLADMREWYRRKLRELSERRLGETEAREIAIPAAEGTGAEASADILALVRETDPGDGQLGDLLRSLELVDADTLSALLAEGRKHRQSLRHVLLASGYVTLYQLALIEAGNLNGLMLGPVRVMDRLRVTPRETVYRVYDPRRSLEATNTKEGYALLRHLVEAEMQDAVHPDEFRQRFSAAAAVQHSNLAATFEVLEINGRPAVLQEWVTGLPATDWPALATVPGVWFRLLKQAALGLDHAHQAGLVHGHLLRSRLVLTCEGILKICGLGEPPWLLTGDTGGVLATAEEGPAGDLAALGRIVTDWATIPPARRKGTMAKPLPQVLADLLGRFTSETAETRFAEAADLLDAMDRVRAEVPDNAEAWIRLLRHVGEHSAEDHSLRQSA